VFKWKFSRGGVGKADCPICRNVYGSACLLLKNHLRLDCGAQCRNALVVSWLAADLGVGDDDSDTQFVLDWFDDL